MWDKIVNVPADREVELAVIDADGAHALVFPCRKTPDGWVNAETGKRIEIHPTHWRLWRPPASNGSGA
ncbi:MAG: hypothetical protein BroJett030_12140 [Alphaproteobacteria bacterium]|nr:MAG: hypothetical protein BroJett030_12140 [Alphaproteobacteria bacterium]